MTFDYAAARATAERLIAKFGQTANIRRLSTTGDDWNPTITTTDYACTLAVVDYTSREIDGTQIRAGDKKAIISTQGLAISPTTDDRLVIGSEVHEIVRIMPLSPGGTVVIWQAQARL